LKVFCAPRAFTPKAETAQAAMGADAEESAAWHTER